MEITINNIDIEISIFDNLWIALIRYSLPEEDALPSYFRVEEDVVLREGISIKAIDIREELKDISLKEFKIETVRSLHLLYPRLSITDISTLYMLLHITKKDIVDVGKRIDKRYYGNKILLDKTVDEFRHSIISQRKRLKEEIKLYDKEISKLQKLKPVEITDFAIDSVTQKYLLDIPLSVPLDNIFDIITTSKVIPFIHLKKGEKDWFKIYSKIIPEDDWIDGSLKREKDGIYFKIYNASESKVSTRIKIANLYSSGIWNKDHEVFLNIRKLRGGVDENVMRKRFLSSLPSSYKNVILREVEQGIKGTYQSYTQEFDHPMNKAIFADLISNNPIFRFFFYLNEVGKTVLEKKTLIFYYSTSKAIEEPLKISIKSQSDGQDAWIDIIISNAFDMPQITSFKTLMSYILKLYNKEYKNVYDNYISYLKPLKAVKLLDEYGQTIKKRKDLKTGKKLQKLKARYPGMFKVDYSKACSKDRQPYLIEPYEVEDVIDMHGRSSVLSFGEDGAGNELHFGCLPRDEGKKYKHAGLVKNKYYGDEVPYLPCCFTKDKTKQIQQIKESLKKGEIAEKGEKFLTAKTGHILTPNKITPLNRLAMLPYYLNFMVTKYKMITIDKEKIYPFLSLGVVQSPDSFFHCVMAAMDEKYIEKNIEDRIDAVIEIKEELAESEDIILSSMQELYGYSVEEAKDILLEDDYIDASMWIRAAELYFNCRIFLYETTEDDPRGEILIPRHAKVYLRPVDNRDNYIFILRKATPLRDYPYQCEIIVQYLQGKSWPYKFSFNEEDDIVDVAQKFYSQTNIVSLIDGKMEYPYSIDV